MYLQSSANGVVLRNKPVFIMMMYNGAAHDRSLYKRRKVKYAIRRFFFAVLQNRGSEHLQCILCFDNRERRCYVKYLTGTFYTVVIY